MVGTFRRFGSLLGLIFAAAPVGASELLMAQNLQALQPVSGRGKHLAILRSFLMDSGVTVGPEQHGHHEEGIAGGIAIWAKALPDNPFLAAVESEQPMIVVRFVQAIGAQGNTQGQISFNRSIRWGARSEYSLQGTMLVRDTTGSRNLTEPEISQVVAHELGHVLGLADRDCCTGLMGYFVAGQPRLAPSAEELAAVREYRQTLRQSIDRLESQ